MTMKELAAKLGTTPMTIYRKLKKAGIDVETLRDANTGELTPSGCGVIASLFDSPKQPDTSPDAPEGPVKAVDAADDKTAVSVLQARIDGMQALLDATSDERDELRRQVAALTAALEREQADRQHERLLLTGGTDNGQRRRGLFWWLRRGGGVD